MSRPQALTSLAVAAVLAFTLAACGGDESEAQTVAEATPAPDCASEARDLNPSNRSIEPRRGEPLIPRTDGHIPIGFNDSSFLIGQVELEQALKLYGVVGATIVRLPLDWGEVEGSPGEADFAKYDEIYCAAIDAGVRPLWHITGVPPWAAPDGACDGPPCVRPPEDEHLAQLRRFAELAAIRYPRSAAFEAWNEPNLTAFWGGVPNPDEYLPVLEAIYDGVKDGRPGTPVLGGALSNNPTDTPDGNLSLQTYLGGLVAQGAIEHMDGLSLHAYPIAPLGTPDEQFTPALEFVRSALASAEGGVRVWITEAGAPTDAGGVLPAVTPDQQAEMMAATYQVIDRSADGDAVVYHTLLDPTPAVPGGPGFGFFSAPLAGVVVPKPAVCRVLRASRPSATCPRGAIEL